MMTKVDPANDGAALKPRRGKKDKSKDDKSQKKVNFGTVEAILSDSPEANAEMEALKKDFYLPSHPDILPLESGQRLIVLGDIHGRYDVLLTCLGESKIIDSTPGSEPNWIAGNTVCVQLGDILDREHQEEKCIRLLCRLAQQAVEHGGALILLWGNHEYVNAEGIFACTVNHREFESSFGDVLDKYSTTWRNKYEKSGKSGYAARSAAFEPGGLLSEPFMSNLKVSVKVGRTVMVHGGLTITHLALYGGSIQSMNRSAKNWILGRGALPICFMSNGPVWIRDYSHGDFSGTNKSINSMADAVLVWLGADRMVVGHTVQRSGVNSILGGKIWRVDVGDGYNGGKDGNYPSVMEDYMYLKALALEVQATDDGEKTNIVSREGGWRYN